MICEYTNFYVLSYVSLQAILVFSRLHPAVLLARFAEEVARLAIVMKVMMFFFVV